ncbi:MAG: type III-A CRISPR-associated RAMP protein Csm3 [Candidatus Hydrothermarchaeota archaeon]
MKLLSYAKLSGTIKLKTGLHIGTGEEVGKGEPLPVMRSLRTGLPYVPGSSLKGKMRCLLEISYGKIGENNGPCDCGRCQICILFGSGSTKKIFEPTRLIFRDSYLSENFEKELEKIGLEEKTGVRIDRKTGTVARGALFNIQRVPEGFEFDFEISARIFENDDKEAVKKWLAMGLYFLEQDTFGGSGTRGAGYIEFKNIKFDDKEFEEDWRDRCAEIKGELLDLKIKKE